MDQTFLHVYETTLLAAAAANTTAAGKLFELTLPPTSDRPKLLKAVENLTTIVQEIQVCLAEDEET